ncbi:MAG: hypothetical protein HQL73_02770 [Magnetococcales bacterium]|nr:hypothetical protein [Magnetococcales bacterium]
MNFLGQVEKLEMNVSEDVKELQDYTTLAGGIVDSVTRIKKVELAMTMVDASPENIALAFYGKNTAGASSTITSESHTANAGALTLLSGTGFTGVTATVAPSVWTATHAYAMGDVVEATSSPSHFYVCTAAGTSGSSEPTWKTDGTATTDGSVTWSDKGMLALTSGTDFQVNSAGLFFPAGGRVPSTDVPITVTYTRAQSYIIEGATMAGNEYKLVWAGQNAADAGSPIRMTCHRVKFSPGKKISMIASDFIRLDFSGSLLMDDSITGEGLSKYFVEEFAPN